MAKEKAKPASADEEVKAVKKKAVETTADLDEVDPLAEVKALQKEEIDSEAIPVTELRKAVKAKAVPGEFDWDAYETKGFGEGYSAKERESMVKLYEGTVTTVDSGELVEAIVVGINDRDVILKIGLKSDGLVPLAEFK